MSAPTVPGACVDWFRFLRSLTTGGNGFREPDARGPCTARPCTVNFSRRPAAARSRSFRDGTPTLAPTCHKPGSCPSNLCRDLGARSQSAALYPVAGDRRPTIPSRFSCVVHGSITSEKEPSCPIQRGGRIVAGRGVTPNAALLAREPAGQLDGLAAHVSTRAARVAVLLADVEAAFRQTEGRGDARSSRNGRHRETER